MLAVQGHEQALCLRRQATSLTQRHDTAAQGYQAMFGPQHNDTTGMGKLQASGVCIMQSVQWCQATGRPQHGAACSQRREMACAPDGAITALISILA